MQAESHARARLLLDRAAVEDISAPDRRWLDAHTAACDECARYAELSRRAVRALDHFSFDLDQAAAGRVEQAVRRRAAQLAPEPAARGAWIASLAAFALTIAGSLAMWRLVAWLAGRAGLPASTWQIAFALCWLLPSVLLDILLVFRTRFAEHAGEELTI